jgi:hypothetical protein
MENILTVPTLYKEVSGFTTFEKVYDYVVKRMPLNFKAIEVGVWQGRSAVYLLEKTAIEDKTCTLDLIDIWKFDHPFVKENEGNIVDVCINNIKKAGFISCINVLQVDSSKASLLYDDKSLDFVMVDTDHSYETTKKEIAAWCNKIKSGGYLGFDDYANPDFPGVKEAVDEYLAVADNVDFTKSNICINSMLIKYL